jgi:lipopolysaccharide transport system ATP-binding protein
MSDVILKVENVSKLYRLGTVGTGTFGGDVQRFWKTKILGQEDPFLKIGQTNDRTSKEKAEFVWALQDINFEVKRGEVLGIVGKNGAGKSTLLKLLSRITSPTTGSIKSAGRMASLLEVGTGFHPELTGRENVYLNGAVLGMTKKEIRNKFDEIVDFSGCELYIDTPTKRYSTGMTVRLGFAVAAFLDPEILVVDEVLAVGDAEFQKKAIGKMKDVSKHDGRTVLFVSHNLASLNDLCTTGVLIENGKLKFKDNIQSIINQYQKANILIKKSLPYELEGYIKIYDFNNKINNNKLQVEIEFELIKNCFDFRIGIKIFNSANRVVMRSLLTDLISERRHLVKGHYILKSEIDLSNFTPDLYRICLHNSIFNIKDFNLEEFVFEEFEILQPKFFNQSYRSEKLSADFLTFNSWELNEKSY